MRSSTEFGGFHGVGRRYTESEKRLILQGFKTYEGSLTRYAKEVGVTYVTLRRWCQSGMTMPAHGPAPVGGFLELQVRQRSFSMDASEVDVELPGGIRLRFAAGTDAGYIGRLVRELVA
jgi:hypothetical protein